MLSFRIGGSSFRDFRKSLRVQGSPGTTVVVAVAQVSQVLLRNHSKGQYAVSIGVKIASPVHIRINLRLAFIVEQQAT